MKSISPRPKRILMTADTVGGVWTYSLELARALTRHGVTVVLATMGRRPNHQQRDEIHKLSKVELCESAYKLEWMPEPWQDVEAANDWLLGLERQFQPDVIHLNGYVHAALPWQAPKLVVGHSCVLSWWRAVHGTDAPAEWNVYRQKVTRGLRSADLVVAPSAAMLEELERCYGPLGPSQVIHNGRRLHNLRLRPKEALVLSAGRIWDPAKNSSALEAIAPELPWPVCIAGEPARPGEELRSQQGDGECEGLLSHPAKGHHPLPIRYLGRVSPAELARWFERAALYALPARYEPFGLSVLEAAQAGCALVLGDLPSLRELWADAAVFVSPADPEELKEAIKELVASPLWRAELAHRAKARAEQFTPEAMASGYLAAYSRLLMRSRSSLSPSTFGRTGPQPSTVSSAVRLRPRSARLRPRCGQRRHKAQPHTVVP